MNEENKYSNPFFVPIKTDKEAMEFVSRLDVPQRALQMNDSQASEIRTFILMKLGIDYLDKIRWRIEPTNIDVPNMGAEALVEKAQKIGMKLCTPQLGKWDFMTDEHGKRYEVMTLRFGRVVSTDEVRKTIRELGFVGNTAAFIAWVTMNKPDGMYISIPEDHRLRMRYRRPSAAYFDGWKDHYSLDLGSITHDWATNWVFVAFREVTKP